ncbi:hypothetical protein OAH51_00360 [Verrucomicrobia bacterium]|nr:hypothetical protein [Verrucomicrobiota bacterium]
MTLVKGETEHKPLERGGSSKTQHRVGFADELGQAGLVGVAKDAVRLLRRAGEHAARGFAQQTDVTAQFAVFRLAKRRVVGPGETEGGPDLVPDTCAGGDAQRLPGPAIFKRQAVYDEQRVH